MIYFFYGDEEFNLSKEVKKFKDKLDKNFIEMSFKSYENPKFPDLLAILKSQPMMFGKMLILINCLNYFSSKKADDKGFDDKQLEEIKQALDNCNENLDIIFAAQIPPDSQKKIDKRKKLFKLLAKYNSQEFLQIPSYKTAELEAWIKQQAKAKKLKITDEIASNILIQIGSNLRMLDSELEKLKIYAGENAVTKDMVKEICVTNEDLFVFADYLIKGNISKALEEYQKLLTKKHPLEILSVLHTLLHNSIQIKAYSSKYSPDEISKMINMHPYRVKLEIQKLKNVSLKSLVKLKENLTNAEYKIKTGQSSLETDKEVEYALLQ
ncbi:DNA polymerase III subunit delta [bacterium]|nr:DNA polymerase III subunit delta [bacterium]